jgi:hypothetical protein
MLVFAGVKRQELYKVIGATLQPCNIITKHTVIINDNNRSSLFACFTTAGVNNTQGRSGQSLNN